MALTIGLRLASQVDDTEAIVVDARTPNVEIRCGGAALVPKSELPEHRLPMTIVGDGNRIGKRYRHDELGVEILITRAGEGALEIDGVRLTEKSAARLPSSD
jgi:hypothetical protein